MKNIPKYSRLLALVVGIFIAQNSHAQSFLTNGLISYYPFNGNADDAFGKNNGTVYGATLTTDRFGNTNSAYSFNGTNADIVAYAASGWPEGNSPRSVTVWFLTTPITGDLFTFGDGTVTDARFSILWGDDPSQLPAFVGENDDYDFPFPNYTGWTQLVITYDGTNGIIYFNGAYWASFIKPSLNTVGTMPLVIGADSLNRDDEFFSGALDDIRIYNVALTSNEVAQLYAIESPPIINIQKAVYLTCNNLWTGSNYVVQASTDLINWTNQGSPFTATTNTWQSTNYWDVDNWNQLFFRLVLQ